MRSGKAPSAHRKSSSTPRGRSADDRAGIEAVLREVPCCESGAIPGLADQVDRLVPRQLPDDAGNTRHRNRLCPGHVTCVVLVRLPHVHNPAPALGRHHQLPHINVLNHNPTFLGSPEVYPPGYNTGNQQHRAGLGIGERTRLTERLDHIVIGAHAQARDPVVDTREVRPSPVDVRAGTKSSRAQDQGASGFTSSFVVRVFFGSMLMIFTHSRAGLTLPMFSRSRVWVDQFQPLG